jgi:predicted extracellular nuclease
MKKTFLLFALACLYLSTMAAAQIYITEWMYDGTDGEFIELTNVGTAAIDMTGWSYDDDSREPGKVDLSAFGIVAPGQSVILTEVVADDFRIAWGLDASVRILGGNEHKLGRNDEINIFNAEGGLVDRLTYNDDADLGPRTRKFSGNIPLAALGSNDANAAILSAANDIYGSYTSSGGDLANPGFYIPEPATVALLAFGAVALLRKKN